MDAVTKNLPRHVAIIMDGNGRWGEEKSRGRLYGHRKGAAVVRTIVAHAKERGIEYLTLYAFSTENWKRPNYEVNTLMRLMRQFTIKEVENFVEADIKVRFIGNRDRLPPELQRAMLVMEEKTTECLGMVLTVAINYGGRDEIVRAAEALARSGEPFTEVAFAEHLDTRLLPDVDLLIRTGGNERISNFLLWQAAYAELRFVDTYWPDFTPEEFDLLLQRYGEADRRFGALKTAAE